MRSHLDVRQLSSAKENALLADLPAIDPQTLQELPAQLPDVLVGDLRVGRTCCRAPGKQDSVPLRKEDRVLASGESCVGALHQDVWLGTQGLGYIEAQDSRCAAP